jgi:superoxide dismutase
MTAHATLERVALHDLPPLPYAENALDPAISANTIALHYGKHHKGYVDTLNKLTGGTSLRAFRWKGSSARPPANPTRPRSSTTRRNRGTTRFTGAACDRRAAASPLRH